MLGFPDSDAPHEEAAKLLEKAHARYMLNATFHAEVHRAVQATLVVLGPVTPATHRTAVYAASLALYLRDEGPKK